MKRRPRHRLTWRERTTVDLLRIYEDTRWSIKRALYRTGAAGCPQCGLRQGHKMDCWEGR